MVEKEDHWIQSEKYENGVCIVCISFRACRVYAFAPIERALVVTNFTSDGLSVIFVIDLPTIAGKIVNHTQYPAQIRC